MKRHEHFCKIFFKVHYNIDIPGIKILLKWKCYQSTQYGYFIILPILCKTKTNVPGQYGITGTGFTLLL